LADAILERRFAMNRKLLKQEFDKVIEEQVEASIKQTTSVIMKQIALELTSHELDWDEDYNLPNNVIARLIYMYVRREVEERVKCKSA
jgi:hypothetical protein